MRPGKIVYRGVLSDRTPADFPEYQGFMAVEAIEHTVLANGQTLLILSIELDSWWTNLPYAVRQCTALYHDHGTSEQFHSELKSDMGIELLPSGNLKKNALVLELATVAFNYLRFTGQAALQSAKAPADEKSRQLRCRLCTVLLDYIKVGCKIVRHANQTIRKFGRNCHTFFAITQKNTDFV